MFGLLRRHRRERRLRRLDTSVSHWARASRQLPLLRSLDDDERSRLRALAALFLDEKSIEPIDDIVLDLGMQQTIALQACLPVLGLGLDWLDGWRAVLVYPDRFVSEIEDEDEAGVVHRWRETRSGESWDRGPLILSWADIEASRPLDGYNVVVHEIAHKLDVLDGATTGKPPLHRGMSDADWQHTFQGAYDDFCARVDAGEPVAIDDYAATAPSEFFAVLSEAFFETPAQVAGSYPAVYDQLSAFYRQDPLTRLQIASSATQPQQQAHPEIAEPADE